MHHRGGKEKRRDPIAIIGIGCRFPGNATGPEAFWEMLCTGVDAVSEIPADRWNIRSFYDPEPGTPGKTYARWGGFIKDIDKFDAEFFGISPREAAFMDPQQRLLLETSYEAFEDAGQRLEQLSGSRTGVFIGISTNDYSQIQSTYDDRTGIETHSSTGGALSIVSNRISYCFDLRGPSLSVDTACSSSLVAVHLACRSIWNNESTMAIAGGVNVIIGPEPFIGFGKLAMLSQEGRCKAFDATGNGFVRAEGAGVVLLKPLSQAMSDGDPVYAVICGTAVNQDGRTNGITVPNEEAQASMLWEACTDAGVAPEMIQYIEAHGTGTAVGDPIETNALGEVLCANRPDGQECVIGSVKTNLGHLEAGAGIAGLIKVALSLKHSLIPPNLHFNEPNPLIEFDKLKLRVQRELGPWPANGASKYAGVNSFGFGGTNAHILLSETPPAPKLPPKTTEQFGEPLLLPFSARTRDALKDVVRRYADLAKGGANGSLFSLHDLAYNLIHRRTHHEHRLVAVVHSKDELAEHLHAFAEGESRPGIRTGYRTHDKPKIGFVFSGQGPQWWGMGRQLLEHEPVFREVIEECDRLMSAYGTWSLLEQLSADEEHSRMAETSISQPSIFALQVGLAALWKSWGIEPDAVVGHSVGEVAAAHVAGIYSLGEALRIIYHRGRCMDLASSKGKMIGAGLTLEEAKEVIRGYENRVSIAAVNSPSSVTLSGEAEALNDIYKLLEERQVFASFLKVNYAFHSPQMEPVKNELLASLGTVKPGMSSKAMFSTVTGHREEGDRFTEEYWWRNVRQSVRFADAVSGMIDDGCNVFVELSAHPALASYVSECLASKQKQGTVLHSLRRKEDERVNILASLGSLYTIGYPVDWNKLYPERRPLIKLPNYPWQHESYWHESEISRDTRLGIEAHPLLGRKIQSADPTWRKQLSHAMLPYLRDHKVQGHTVFPAAGYVELALAAAKEVFGAGTYIVEDLDFQKALFIAASGEAPTIQSTYYPADSSFAVSSRTGNSEWTVHAVGKIRIESSGKASDPVSLAALKQECVDEIPKELCYQIFSELGLQFGPAFQGIQQLWRRDGESLGLVEPPDPLKNETDGYLFHPSLLDSCFQVLSGTLGIRSGTNARVYLPVQIRQAKLYSQPGSSLWSHAVLLRSGTQSLEIDLRVYDENGSMVMEIRGFRGQSVDTIRDPGNLENWIYEFRWLPKPRASEEHHPLPFTSSFNETLKESAARISNDVGWKARYKEIEPALDRLVGGYIVAALKKLGWTMTKNERVDIESLAQRLGVIARHHRLLARSLDILAKDGILEKADNMWGVKETPPSLDLLSLWRTILHRFPAVYPELMLLESCGRKLDEVLTGEADPLHLIFPEGSLVTAEHLYQDSPSFKFYNLMAAATVAHALDHLPEGRTIRLIEIGGGTAGMTSYILPKLPPDQTEYVFTDVTAHFLHKAEQKFRDYPFVRYQLLDIEKDPAEQQFDPHSFDIILASDVLHATCDLGGSLGNVKKLLASGGLLVLLETDNAGRWVDLVFGATEGWWRFTDFDLRPSYPLLSRDRWVSFLEESGFSQPGAFSEMEVDQEASQVVLVARGPILNEEPTASVAPTVTSTMKRWLIFTDSGSVGEGLAARLRARGDECILVSHSGEFKQLAEDHFEVSPVCIEDFQLLLQQTVRLTNKPIHGVVHCWSLDSKPIDETNPASLYESTSLGCISAMHFVQAWAGLHDVQSPDLFLITKGAQTVGDETISVAQSPLCGLGRVIMNEHQDLHCRMIDLSERTSEDERQSLCDEIIRGDAEDEVALRGSARFVQRLVRASLSRSARHEKKVVRVNELPIRLESASPGVIDSLTLREVKRRAPGIGEVEIQVAAAAMNFRDVMKVLGIYPIETDEDLLLGDECAGTIVAVGEGVEGFRVGDEVITMAPGCYGSYVVSPSSGLMHKPPDISFEEAVTIPVAFLTAYYALHHVARIEKGERVLIHAATGGVGLAAIQIAQHAGAEVFATAGTPEKRAFLKSLGIEHVMDSRSLLFADEVLSASDTKGVDIVLNSLAGEAIQKGLACLAPYGRFLEIGKRDIHLNTKVGLRIFKNNISFSAIYLKSLMEDKPGLVRKLLDECMELFRSREFNPLPYRVFSIGDGVSAFRHMAQAKHIGKIVLTIPDQEVAVEPLRDESLSFSPDSSYLITGGLGGFGLAVAKWMVENGARHLVLVGRNGAATDEARTAVDEMKNSGATIVVATADVSRNEDVERVLADIRQNMPGLRGVVHGAMVLDDGILLQLSEERFRKVMAPKMLGAWNLHVLTQKDQLDFFVMFSSVTTMAGNPGQGNYVAANTFLDTLAHHRRRMNLPALTVNWGHISDVGYVARHETVAEHLDSVGLRGFSSKQGLKILGQLMARGSTHVGVMDIDWQKWGKFASAQGTPRFAQLVNADSQDQLGDDAGRIRNLVLGATPEERPAIIESYLKEQVARVLGTSAVKLEAERPLNEMGLDSLMMIELKNRIEKEIGASLPTVELMRGPNIVKLSQVLLNQITNSTAVSSGQGGKRIEPVKAMDESKTTELLEKIDQLSEQEVDSLLTTLVDENEIKRFVTEKSRK